MSVGSCIRGSEWRQWDLHIHTPASFHWLGERFGADPFSAASKALVDQMIQATQRLASGVVPDPDTCFSTLEFKP